MSDTHDLNAANGLLADINGNAAKLTSASDTFAASMTRAFATSTASAQKFDDVLQSLVLKMSDLTVTSALQPLIGSAGGGVLSLLTSLFGSSGSGTSTAQVVTPNGTIGTPSYLKMYGAAGLADDSRTGAASPPGITANGIAGAAAAGGNTINVQIATPDLDGFRRSESYVTGQIARAVARGQRSL